MSIEAEIVSNQINENDDAFWSDTPHPKAALSLCHDASRYDNGDCMDCGRDRLSQVDYFAGVIAGKMQIWTQEIRELSHDVDLRKTNPSSSQQTLAPDSGEPEKEVRGDGDHELRVKNEGLLDQRRTIVRALVKNAAHHVDNTT